MKIFKNIANSFFKSNVIIVSLILFTLISCETNNTDNTVATSTLAILVNNSSTSSSATPSCATTGTCKIFITNSTAPVTAGVSGIDAHCNNATNKPSGGGTYKALVTDGTSRRACTSANCTTGGTSEHIDWVLKPNQQYKRKDGTTVIGTTNANGLFPIPLTNSMEPNLLNSTNYVITGLNADWINSNDCENWTTRAPATSPNGLFGKHQETDMRAFAFAGTTCADLEDFYNAKAICVEQ
ncbi:DUF1554 domain-containing protein [Leptospira levettii]|uniref:DUF1554 domain-containing protein n=1 Tax=Leptospira levettii TaxID=2023178 RepID=UPI0010847FE8|nr:DUF1554 domain-containing protein [Leptospira levettii]MCG6147441.1 DUF1554 domain-containing protein [Leptospira levettii]MCW7507506.1 DUF1554 domain-containing protein [Leptospira levettii]MCW7518596.1 DUF1554 domain-containing protein [Leptospira levettii]TGK99030.1 DUF1554 domain-containing protein [Leptospira levettii]